MNQGLEDTTKALTLAQPLGPSIPSQPSSMKTPFVIILNGAARPKKIDSPVNSYTSSQMYQQSLDTHQVSVEISPLLMTYIWGKDPTIPSSLADSPSIKWDIFKECMTIFKLNLGGTYTKETNTKKNRKLAASFFENLVMFLGQFPSLAVVELNIVGDPKNHVFSENILPGFFCSLLPLFDSSWDVNVQFSGFGDIMEVINSKEEMLASLKCLSVYFDAKGRYKLSQLIV